MNAAELSHFCLSLPGVREDLKWGQNRIFSVADTKMFALIDLKDNSCAFKVEDDLFLGFCDRPGFHPSPYLARAHWISLDFPYALQDEELRELIRQSHQLVVRKLPRRLQPGLLLP
ncbi:MAG: MmcQ/YjbR family DNA-binding protein [Pseudomonas sp.]